MGCGMRGEGCRSARTRIAGEGHYHKTDDDVVAAHATLYIGSWLVLSYTQQQSTVVRRFNHRGLVSYKTVEHTVTTSDCFWSWPQRGAMDLLQSNLTATAEKYLPSPTSVSYLHSHTYLFRVHIPILSDPIMMCKQICCIFLRLPRQLVC